MKKITKVKNRTIDGRCPKMSISHKTYKKGLDKLRNKAKKEHKLLLTDDGVEDYSEIK